MEAIIVLLVVIAVLGGVLWLLFALIGAIVSSTGQAQSPRGSAPLGDMSAEDEGNVHSGPYGYSPNTAYSETQYGSGFDPDAEWAERTGYDEDHER